MNYQKHCECCGHIETAYAHPLNRGLVLAFKQLCEFYFTNKRPVNLANDLNLNHNQLANFQKLRYFGIVADTQDGWVVTTLGQDWWNGSASILNPAGSLSNQVLPQNHEAWGTNKPRKYVRISDYIDVSYKQRADYSKEKASRASTPSLF